MKRVSPGGGTLLGRPSGRRGPLPPPLPLLPLLPDELAVWSAGGVTTGSGCGGGWYVCVRLTTTRFGGGAGLSKRTRSGGAGCAGGGSAAATGGGAGGGGSTTTTGGGGSGGGGGGSTTGGGACGIVPGAWPNRNGRVLPASICHGATKPSGKAEASWAVVMPTPPALVACPVPSVDQ